MRVGLVIDEMNLVLACARYWMEVDSACGNWHATTLEGHHMVRDCTCFERQREESVVLDENRY